jgi:TetR/AcrR family tetracycline transcriptional repressor
MGKVQKPSAQMRANDAELALSEEVIVGRALELIDRDGLDSFSIRNLATSLGVYPTAIYWYVPNRNELLARLVVLVLSNILPAVKRRSWQQFLRDLFTNYRVAVRNHPNIAPLLTVQMVSNSAASDKVLELILANLERAGFAGQSLVGAYNTVIAAMVGFAAQEFAPGPADEREAWESVVVSRISSVSSSEYPVLARNLPLLTNRAFALRWQNGVSAPLDTSYDFYVEAVIAGLAQMAQTASSERSPND